MGRARKSSLNLSSITLRFLKECVHPKGHPFTIVCLHLSPSAEIQTEIHTYRNTYIVLLMFPDILYHRRRKHAAAPDLPTEDCAKGGPPALVLRVLDQDGTERTPHDEFLGAVELAITPALLLQPKGSRSHQRCSSSPRVPFGASHPHGWPGGIL